MLKIIFFYSKFTNFAIDSNLRYCKGVKVVEFVIYTRFSVFNIINSNILNHIEIQLNLS